jgi:hypothetical protein
MYSCQQVLVNRNNDLINILTFLCEESHKLTNMGIYLARQLYFKAKKIIDKYDLELDAVAQHFRFKEIPKFTASRREVVNFWRYLLNKAILVCF